MTFRAVLFDLGGVVLGSPLHAIADYERELGIPAGFVNRLVAERGAEGAWGRLERGKLEVPEFVPAFEAECREAGHALDAAVMMVRISEASQPALSRARSNPSMASRRTSKPWMSTSNGGSAEVVRSSSVIVV